MAMGKGFETLARDPLLDALRNRRSRRFGVGMHMDSGPMACRSPQPGLPLTEDEEAFLAFAACRRYGRFPACAPPLRTVLGFQAGHVDHGFYERFYLPEALSDTRRRHMELWHG